MLKDKVIVVTGGAGLIGRGFVQSIIDNHGIAVIADLDIKSARDVQSSILKNNEQAKIETEEMDITNSSSIDALILKVKSKFGRIDALVNNAYPRNKNWGRNFFAKVVFPATLGPAMIYTFLVFMFKEQLWFMG